MLHHLPRSIASRGMAGRKYESLVSLNDVVGGVAGGGRW